MQRYRWNSIIWFCIQTNRVVVNRRIGGCSLCHATANQSHSRYRGCFHLSSAIFQCRCSHIIIQQDQRRIYRTGPQPSGQHVGSSAWRSRVRNCIGIYFLEWYYPLFLSTIKRNMMSGHFQHFHVILVDTVASQSREIHV